jgi:Tfp pilus assembly protein PilF
MKRAFAASTLLIALVLVIAVGCGSNGNLATADAQRQFGVRMAKMNLWREAMFRFKRAVEIEPDNAMAHNNLAVAYEAIGDFDAAAKEYREALRLDRSNDHIQKNYSRFVEFTTRSKKRPPKPVTPPPATDTSATAPTPETTNAPPPPPGELR